MSRIISGRAAEQLAMTYENLRLSKSRILKPKYVGDRRGLGYDIESYNSENDPSPRYIEVKSSSFEGSVFFTERERINLLALGKAAWLYIVDVQKRKILKIIQDPIRFLEFNGANFLYRVKI